MHSFTQLVPLFEQRFANCLPFPAKPQSLYDPCRYLLQLGGKRIRPILCLMANELFGEINDDAWNGASGIELFHNFTLIHDDIMDKSPLRRGQATVHTKYGMVAGILSGDVMCLYAYKQFANIENYLPIAMKLFTDTGIEVCEGQQLDMDYETRDTVTLEEYINMITLKTSVLLACSLKMGAILGGSLDDNANKLYSFGKNLGIAFQLKDDYLDAYGTTEIIGKQNGGDIIANKKTYLLIQALECATESQKEQIKTLLITNNENKVANMVALYNETGAKQECINAVVKYSDIAFKCLEDVALPTKRKKYLFDLATYLLQRDK